MSATEPAPGYNRIPARIDLLYFTYADPGVEVTTEQRLVEHETIDNKVVIQAMGRKPDQISVNGVVPDYELDIIDDLTEAGVITLRTERWKGSVIVKSTNTTFKRARSKDGSWLYDVRIECLEVEEKEEKQERRTDPDLPTVEEMNELLSGPDPIISSDERGASRQTNQF